VDIGQVGVAYFRVSIVRVHGVDCFGELRAATFVDAARIDPDPFKPVLQGLAAAILDLREASLFSNDIAMFGHVFEDTSSSPHV
jgi:hypothetical protein